MDLLNLLLSRRSIRRYTESPFLKGLWRPFWPQGSSPPAGAAGPGSLLWFRIPKRWKPCLIAARVPQPCWPGKGRHSGLCRSGENRRLDRGLCHCHEQYAPDGPPPGVGQLLDSRPPAPGGGRYLHRGLLPRAALRPGPLHLGGHSLPGLSAIQPEPHSLEDLPREKIHWDTFLIPFPVQCKKRVYPQSPRYTRFLFERHCFPWQSSRLHCKKSPRWSPETPPQSARPAPERGYSALSPGCRWFPAGPPPGPPVLPGSCCVWPGTPLSYSGSWTSPQLSRTV